MKRKTKLMITLFAIVMYGFCIASLKGQLPNQTATLVNVQNSNIQSLVVNQTVTTENITLNRSVWNITTPLKNYTAYNDEEKLIISGTCTSETFELTRHLNETYAPLFNATQLELCINFSKTPHLHMVAFSTPDVILSFHVGLNKSSVEDDLIKKHDAIEIDDILGVIWINISYPEDGEKIDDFKRHHITIDVAEKLSAVQACFSCALHNQIFEGLQIRGRLIGFKAFNNSFMTTIESIYLTKEPLYHSILAGGNGSPLDEGTVTYLIRKTDILSSIENYPYLQRIYVSYTMDAPQNTMYTIYLLCKGKENLTAVRSGFVFLHSLSNTFRIGTYVDWRKPIYLDHNFEPVPTLNVTMNEGDYAIFFTPHMDNRLRTIQLHDVFFTFSKLQYSAFVIPNIKEEVLMFASIFILTIAGTLPTVLMFYLFYLYKKNRLESNKNTTIKMVIVGLGLRLILAPISAYADDIQIFAEIGALYFGAGVFGAQWVSLPGFVYLQTAAYFPYALLRSFGFQDFQFLALAIYSIEAFFTKIPSILGDLGSFYFIQKMAEKFSPKNKILLSGLYLLNPLTVYTSGALGQFDTIFTFAVIASIYYSIAEYNSFKAAMFSSFAAILNPVGIATFIPLLVNVSLRESRRAMVKSLLVGAGIFGVLMLPFFFEANSPVLLASYERLMGAVPGEPFYGKQLILYPYGTLTSSSVGYGLTFRFLLEIMGFELGPIFYPYGAAVIFLIFAAIFIYKIRKAYVSGSYGLIYTGTFMLGVASLFQLTFPTIFDQFVIWIASLLLVSYILCQNRKFLLIFTMICISTGFIYICVWRDYLQLISGVEVAPIVNPFITNLASAFIGVLYSITLIIILVTTLRMWTSEKTLSKIRKFWTRPQSPRRTQNEGTYTEQARYV